MEKLFVYGTLKDHHIQQAVFGRVAGGKPARLKGYKKIRLQLGHNTYPIAIPDAKETIEGVVISVTPAELKSIDHYETGAYRREKITLESGQEAWVYQE
jgi:gamma-glutamylcyclotransferase (GGCT)/AIG2-like uncharacterized protein YtfP